ncbi:MAG: hypothetical protein GPJ50_06100 [Candidatus Heimdallarchaeota archaeon]|nr:hypothetical protein [Candidatus Heimdallarchaeota archaeon]
MKVVSQKDLDEIQNMMEEIEHDPKVVEEIENNRRKDIIALEKLRGKIIF